MTAMGTQGRSTTILILTEFTLFAFLIILLQTGALPLTPNTRIGLICGLTVTLCSAVLLTFFSSSRAKQKHINQIQEELEHERAERRHQQEQFERDIENKTFELQRIVGALNREIGERTQAEGELKELQKQQELILNSAGEGILGLDNNGKVIFMNNAAEVMLGWTKDELLNNTHHEFIHHTHPDGNPHPVEDCPIYMAYRDGQIHYKTGDIFWCKNGSSFPVEYVSTPIEDRGMLTGAVVVFRDMNTFS